MLGEFLEQDHSQKVRASKAVRRHMEGCWWLRNLLALAAGELLPDGLNDLPLTRDDLQCLCDFLTELLQLRRAAAGAVCRSSKTARSRGRCSGKGLRDGRLGSKALTIEALAAISAANSSSPASASSSSNCSSICLRSRALRSKRLPKSSRRTFSISSFNRATGASECDTSAFALAASALAVAASDSAVMRRTRSAAKAASALARSSGSCSAASFMG